MVDASVPAQVANRDSGVELWSHPSRDAEEQRADSGIGGREQRPREELRLRVVQGPDQEPVSLAMVQAVSQNLHVSGETDESGNVVLPWPTRERPFTLTVGAPGFERISVLNVSEGAPQTVRIDSLSDRFPKGRLEGRIVGKAAPSNRVLLDVAGALSTDVTPNEWRATYRMNGQSFAAVAIEVSESGEVLNWTKAISSVLLDPSMDVVFPAQARTFRRAAVGIESAASGVFANLEDAFVDGRLMNSPEGGAQGSILTTGVVRSQRSARSADLELWGIDDALGPNWLALVVKSGDLVAQMRVPQPMKGSPRMTLPTVRSLRVFGASFQDLSVFADAEGFDALELDIVDTTSGRVLWRVVTAPRAPLFIDALPALFPGLVFEEMFAPDRALGAQVKLLRLNSGRTAWDSSERPWEDTLMSVELSSPVRIDREWHP
jgi:hypothetical protein